MYKGLSHIPLRWNYKDPIRYRKSRTSLNLNIFILSTDFEECARYHCDKHLVKMILEHVQILSTAWWSTKEKGPYRPTHKNHPCTKWAQQCIENYDWLLRLTEALNTEYKDRFCKTDDHKSWKAIRSYGSPKLKSGGGLTEFARAMPYLYKFTTDDAVTAYRNYFNFEKRHLASWKNREIPEWYITDEKVLADEKEKLQLAFVRQREDVQEYFKPGDSS